MLLMHVRFGLSSDGLELASRNATVGEITVGPRGLLRLLESDLGIAPALTHPAEEVALYRECLAECDAVQRFYHRSMQVDPVGTARTLLDWRQQWYLHGWDGAFPLQAPLRLVDMAAVEVIAATRVPPCPGRRLRRVLELLATQRTQIDTLVLLDHRADLPELWQRLAQRLNARPLPKPTPRAAPDSDLGKLQALLLGGEPQPLSGDGSLVVVRALSRDVTAQAVAEVVREQTRDTVVIASRDGIVLDNAFERVGLPRAGFQHYSPFRAASQVLKLALALVWQPLDPHRLLQFLIHPVGPLKWDARTRLAEAVAAEPGIGGPAWQAALAQIGEGRDEVVFWTMARRHPVREGAPVAVLRERAVRCAGWLRQRANVLAEDESAAVYRAAHAQAQAFASAVDRLDVERIAKIEVDRLVDEATRSLPDDSSFAEAGHPAAVGHPGNVVAPVGQVAWWDISPPQLDPAATFSRAEQHGLAAAGVHLPASAEIVAAATRAWQRPVLNCRRRLLLAVHDEHEGRHPLLARITEQLAKQHKGWREARLDDALLHGDGNAVQALRLALAPLPTRALPSKRRWWQLPRPIPPREVESYSSLSKAYYYPHQWVLNYHAKLRGSRIAGVADNALLYGSLAHRLFERFFDDNENWRALSEGDVNRWLQHTTADLIEKEGAVLLETGRGVDRQRVETTLEDTLRWLLTHLRQANVVRVQPEHRVERAFAGGQLQGNVDLLLVAQDGARAVLDAKWGGQRRRETEIAQGRHLQLAIYGFALSDNGWPACGYYIVTTGNVLAPDADFFPGARTAADSAEVVWNKSLATRAWRLEQLARGAIEVNAGADPDAGSQPPAGGLETRVDADRFDDFAWLTGVEPSQ